MLSVACVYMYTYTSAYTHIHMYIYIEICIGISHYRMNDNSSFTVSDLQETSQKSQYKDSM